MNSIYKNKLLIIAVLAIVIGVVVFAYQQSQPKMNVEKPSIRPATEVESMRVTVSAVNEWHEYSGHLEAINQVDIRPRIAGMIMAVHFKDGDFVKKGQLLFSLDQQSYLAEIQQSQAELAVAQANLQLAKSEAKRATQLFQADALAKKEYDEKQNLAQVMQAKLLATQAILSAAKVNLAYTKIHAPISGRISHAEFTTGNTVSPDANAPKLATVVSTNPIYVAFNVDEAVYLKNLREMGQRSVPVQVSLANESNYPHHGVVDSIDNQLDPTTGTIRVRAKLDNANGNLLPGLFSKIRLGSSKSIQTVLIPDTAIGTDQDRKFVFVIAHDQRVQYRQVKVGNLHNGQRMILDGLQQGEEIVVNGIQKIQSNDLVKSTKSINTL